jgi:hypothetical protein
MRSVAHDMSFARNSRRDRSMASCDASRTLHAGSTRLRVMTAAPKRLGSQAGLPVEQSVKRQRGCFAGVQWVQARRVRILGKASWRLPNSAACHVRCCLAPQADVPPSISQRSQPEEPPSLRHSCVYIGQPVQEPTSNAKHHTPFISLPGIRSVDQPPIFFSHSPSASPPIPPGPLARTPTRPRTTAAESNLDFLPCCSKHLHVRVRSRCFCIRLQLPTLIQPPCTLSLPRKV